MEDVLKQLRKDALDLSHRCQDGNLQSVFSCIDIVWVLYDKIMNWSVEKAQADDRDFFIISKGQATLSLYSVLIQKGMFDKREIEKEIGQFHSRYCIQTDRTKFSGGIENNAGSLGHGLPFAVGIAIANRIKGLSNRTFVLCGDGEFTEGTMWESCIFAGDKKLNRLCVIIDDNDSVGAMVDMSSMAEKLKAFQFEVLEVDGHNVSELEKVLSYIPEDKPLAIIAHTVRGYGSETMIAHDVWFHKAPNEEELKMLKSEVDLF